MPASAPNVDSLAISHGLVSRSMPWAGDASLKLGGKGWEAELEKGGLHHTQTGRRRLGGNKVEEGGSYWEAKAGRQQRSRRASHTPFRDRGGRVTKVNSIN